MFAWDPEWGWTFACSAPKSFFARSIASSSACSLVAPRPRTFFHPAVLFQPDGVAAALERLREEDLETIRGGVGRHRAGPEDCHVGVVVPPGVPRRELVVQQSGPDAGEPVRRDGPPAAGPPHQDTETGLPPGGG